MGKAKQYSAFIKYVTETTGLFAETIFFGNTNVSHDETKRNKELYSAD